MQSPVCTQRTVPIFVETEIQPSTALQRMRIFLRKTKSGI